MLNNIHLGNEPGYQMEYLLVGIIMVNIWLILMVIIWLMMVNNNLVDGFNPSEKY